MIPSSVRRLSSYSSARGLTLIEVLVVVALIAILVALSFGILGMGQGAQNRAVARAQINALSGALELFRNDEGAYPNPNQGLVSLFDPPGAQNPSDPDAPDRDFYRNYLRRSNFTLLTTSQIPEGGGDPVEVTQVVDPWGNAYVYQIANPQTQYSQPTLYSHGPLGPNPPAGSNPEAHSRIYPE